MEYNKIKRNISYNTFKNEDEININKIKDMTDIYYKNNKDVFYQDKFNDFIEKNNTTSRRYLKEYLNNIKENYFSYDHNNYKNKKKNEMRIYI